MALNPKLGDWQGRCVWLVGASSGIGEALAHELHRRGAFVVVSARSTSRLQAFEREHPGSLALPLDVTDADAMRNAVRTITTGHRAIALTVYCAGHYQAMRATDFDLAQAHRHLEVNYGGALNLLDALLPQLAAQGRGGRGGHLSLVSSVAGYRGLPKSLAYGPSKAALANLAETLYLDLHGMGLGISLICPGFVATPLTAGNDFHMPALITPAEAAEAMLDGYAKGSFEIHFPKRFTLWLKLLRMLPYRLYFMLVRRVTGV